MVWMRWSDRYLVLYVKIQPIMKQIVPIRWLSFPYVKEYILIWDESADNIMERQVRPSS